MGRGQSPIALPAGPVGRRVEHSIRPRYLAAIGFLPDESGHVVRHRAITIVGEGRRVYRVIGVLSERSCVGISLAGIG